MHHTCHYPSHAHQREVFLREVGGIPHLVEGVGVDKTCNATQKQGGGKHSSRSSTTVGGTGGEHFKENDQHKEDHDGPAALHVVKKTFVGE